MIIKQNLELQEHKAFFTIALAAASARKMPQQISTRLKLEYHRVVFLTFSIPLHYWFCYKEVSQLLDCFVEKLNML